MNRQAALTRCHASLLIAFSCMTAVPCVGISWSAYSEAPSQTDMALVRGDDQVAGSSSLRDETTAGTANDKAASPVGTAGLQSASNSNENSADSEPPTIVDLVSKYLSSDSISERNEIGTEIRKAADGDAFQVGKALRETKFRAKPRIGRGNFTIELPRPSEVKISYRTPESYDDSLPAPLVIQVASKAIPLHCDFDEPTSFVLPNSIIVRLSRPVGGAFHATTETSGDFSMLLKVLRKEFNIDSSRIFLEGIPLENNPAWNIAVGYSHLFAGVVSPGEYLATPYRAQMYPLLLPNLRSVPVLQFGPEKVQTNPGQVDMTSVFADGMEQVARRLNLPMKFHRGISNVDQATHRKLIGEIRDATRPPVPLQLSHWFRYPEQGQCAWLRQTKFAGDVWTAEQLSILPGPEVDADQYITDVLKSLLAYMGGTIEGNTIRIETRRCAEIELLFYENMVDFTKPVVVYINGKKRHDRIVKPSIPTLLEEAYDTFDFQRLVFAKLSFSIKEDAPIEK